jgi:hypothetical protein
MGPADDSQGFEDPDLGPLQDNGGDTMTHEIPAHLAGQKGIAEENGSACGPLDQRGLGAPANFGCDIGAFERQ